MTLRPSVAVTDVIAPALTKCEIVVQYNTFSNHWLYRRGVLERCIYRALKIRIWFGYDSQIIYYHFFTM